MDTANFSDLTALGPAAQVRMFRDFDPLADRTDDRDVPDPYFGGADGFADVLATIERTADGLVEALAEAVRQPTGSTDAG
jgi:protein-tyrosine phosphatase